MQTSAKPRHGVAFGVEMVNVKWLEKISSVFVVRLKRMVYPIQQASPQYFSGHLLRCTLEEQEGSRWRGNGKERSGCICM